MTISNEEKAKISYRHKDKIQRLFKKYVHGNLCIGHFSVNVFFGNGQNIFLSSTPRMAEMLCNHNFINEDSNYNPKIYHNLTMYSWRAVQKHKTDNLINFIKEEKFQMRSGIMVVRNLGNGSHIMYSVATHKKDNPDFPGQFYFLFHCKSNYIAQLGDFLYDNLLSTINEYEEQSGVTMPKLNEFKPIVLDSSFCTDEQSDMYEEINSSTNVDVLKLIEKKSPPLLSLVNNRKINK